MLQFRRARALQALPFAVLAACVLFTPASAQEKAAGEPISMTVSLGDVSLTKLPFIMAADYGIYEKNGLKVRQFITPSAAKVVTARGISVPKENISSDKGDIDIGGASPMIVRMTMDATAPQRVVLATTDHWSRYHVLTRADIKTPEDLKGKRIGYGSFGALNHFSLMMYFKEVGIDPEKDVTMLSNAQEIHNILEGKVDAVAGNGNVVDQAKKAGLNDLANLIPKKYDMPGSSVNAEKKWLANNHEAARRFVKATVEAIALTMQDKEKAFASFRKWYGMSDPAMMEVMYSEAADLPKKPYPSIEGLKNMQKVYTWREITRHKPEEYTDASFVTELDKSGYIDGLYRQASATSGAK
ncbi:MAG: NitT/TauT family transport system substrate-binding protein [Alphaproteobacteria bacterium]|jgi:ABC-type nitrate/sulfonate/bicarbonate transport system substrate-binding protein|nr:NitT/TauT family transport system substrate-binding protein [Alphaproteobacteria bacterium]